MGRNFQYRASSGASEPFKTSGRPYLKRLTFQSGSLSGSQSEQTVNFPSVTKAILVGNESANNANFLLRLAFAPISGTYVNVEGTGSSILLSPGETVSMDVKCRDIYLTVDTDQSVDAYYFVISELTNIPEEHPLSGSGINTL